MSQYGSVDVFLQSRLLGGVPETTYKISPSGGATNITTLIPASSVIRIVTNAAINIKFSTAVTVGAATTDLLIPANNPEYFCVGDTAQRVGAYGTGDVYISIMGRVTSFRNAGTDTGPNSF